MIYSPLSIVLGRITTHSNWHPSIEHAGDGVSVRVLVEV